MPHADVTPNTESLTLDSIRTRIERQWDCVGRRKTAWSDLEQVIRDIMHEVQEGGLTHEGGCRMVDEAVGAYTGRGRILFP